MGETMAEAGRDVLDAHSDALQDCFEILLRYREGVERLLTFSNTVVEGSGVRIYAHRKVGELNQIMQDNVAIIDDVLAAFISPEAKVFSVDQLVRDYGYPDVDLFKIDADWL